MEISPKGAMANSQGRKPLVIDRASCESPKGAMVAHHRPFGAPLLVGAADQGLAPLAIDRRRVAAEIH